MILDFRAVRQICYGAGHFQNTVVRPCGKGQFLYRAQQDGLPLRPQAAMLVQGFSGKGGIAADHGACISFLLAFPRGHDTFPDAGGAFAGRSRRQHGGIYGGNLHQKIKPVEKGT